MTDGYDAFPPGFFHRVDDSDDGGFYGVPRLVTHIDDGAIAAVGVTYEELIPADAEVLDLMSSWVSHFTRPPSRLVVLGMSAPELDANAAAQERVVRDLNRVPTLPFPDGAFDAVVCCVSVDYLVRPLEVFDEAARVLRPGGPFICTFSNRCFPTKAIRGWLASDDEAHVAIVGAYFHTTAGFGPPQAQRRPTPPGGDPLYAVWARREGAAPQEATG